MLVPQRLPAGVKEEREINVVLDQLRPVDDVSRVLEVANDLLRAGQVALPHLLYSAPVTLSVPVGHGSSYHGSR